jgi:hypothetical protein
MFTELNLIVALWLLPVTLNIVLPFTVLIVYSVVKIVQAFFALFEKTLDETTTGTHQLAPSV